MIEPGIGEVRGDMTHRAVLRRRQMVYMLAGRCSAIVARRTVTGDTCVIEHRGYEGTAGHMADTTIL